MKLIQTDNEEGEIVLVKKEAVQSIRLTDGENDSTCVEIEYGNVGKTHVNVFFKTKRCGRV